MSDTAVTPDPPNLWAEVKALTRLGVPIVISLAAATLIGVVDTIMIAPLGTVPLAAASITMSVLIIFYSAAYGFVAIIGVRIAAARGEGNATALSTATRSGLFVAFVTAVLGTAAMLAVRPLLPFIGQPPDVLATIGGYWTAMSLLLIPTTLFWALKGLFDALDAPWIGVALAFGAVALNIPFNWVLIHGVGGWEGLGLVGAGIASLISEGAAITAAVLIWRRSRLCAEARLPAEGSAAERRLQFKEGSILAVGYVGEGGAYSFAGLMMGWFSAAALAAHQIINAVGAILYMVPIGVSLAVSIRVGQAIGSDRRDRLTRIGTAALCVIVAWMSLTMLAILAARGVISNALSNDPEVIAIAVSMFVVIAALQVADGVQGTMLGAARGMMDNRVPVAVTLVAYWVVALPLGYTLGFTLDWGPNGVWIGYGLGLAIAATTITLRYFALARRQT